MDVKQWRCKQGHVLGQIIKNGSDVPQLLVLRHAIDAEADAPAMVDVMLGPVTGSMMVRCDLCGEVKPWAVSVDALLYQVETMPTDLLFRFWEKLLVRAKVKSVISGQ